GELSLRVPQADERTEVGRLGMALNTMLGRIEDAFGKQQASEERLRRFVADASHELRTPVSAVGAYAELFERGAQQRPADLARVLRGVRVETSRMQALIEDLLLLTRLDEGRPLERQPVELVGLAGEAAEAAQTISGDWPRSRRTAAGSRWTPRRGQAPRSAFACRCRRSAWRSLLDREADLLAVGELQVVAVRVGDERPVADGRTGVVRAEHGATLVPAELAAPLHFLAALATDA